MPARWEIRSPKALFKERRTPNSLEDVHLTPSQKYGVLPQAEYVERTGGSVVLNLAGQDKMKHVEEDDFIIHLRSFQGGLERANQAGKVSSAYTVIEPKALADPRYYGWALKSSAFIQELQTTTNQLRDGQSIRWADFIKVPLPSPSLGEQQAIADYLDRETARIDGLIAEQRGLIETLRERRQAVIDDSLDGSEEWEVVPLKHLIERIEQGVSPQAGSVPAQGEEWGVLKSGCVNRGVFRESENKRLPEEFVIDKSLVVRVGDVLVSRASGSVNFVGSCSRVRSLDRKLILSDKIFRLMPLQRVDADFLVWLLNSRVYREQVRLAVSGAQGLANNLPLSSLRTFAFHVPSTVDEQREITAYLNDQTSRIDALIAESEDLIALSLERRAALITAAVTGQIDVRTAA